MNRLFSEVFCRGEQIGFFSLAKTKVPAYSHSDSYRNRRGSSTQDSGKKTFGLHTKYFRIKSNKRDFLKKAVLFFLLSLLSNSLAHAQFNLYTGNKKSVEVPFQYEHNFIIVEIIFNKVFPLKFILDTGAEHTILTKREFTDILDIPYRKKFRIVGADMQTVLFANLATGIHLNMNGVVAHRHNMLVLEEDYFKFEQMTGLEIHGIIGADFFRHFVMKIDYKRRVITFTNPRHFKKPSGKYREYPIEIKKNKPYIITPVTLQNGTTIDAKLLLDTGASLALLLNTSSHPDLTIPENVIVGNIGTGLGGFLEGFMGRVQSYELAGFQLEDIIVNFQEVSLNADTTYANSRNGILGNSILSRFTIITDYQNNRIFVRPIKKFKRKFHYDKSGLLVVASGPKLESFVVSSIIPGSPAAEAGILRGDQIKAINGLPSSLLSLRNIITYLQKREGKRIKMTIVRDGQKIKKEFRLRELI